jgi:hypothetical protein
MVYEDYGILYNFFRYYAFSDRFEKPRYGPGHDLTHGKLYNNLCQMVLQHELSQENSRALNWVHGNFRKIGQREHRRLCLQQFLHGILCRILSQRSEVRHQHFPAMTVPGNDHISRKIQGQENALPTRKTQ